MASSRSAALSKSASASSRSSTAPRSATAPHSANRSLLLGLDIGTTGVKGLLMRPDGTVLATHVEEYPLLLPKPGWAEQDAEEWWRATARACRALIGRAGAEGRDVAALSFSGQMHGLVCLDAAQRPLRPAILWCDQRTTAECRRITQAIGFKRLLRTVGNPALEGFTLPKILWMKRNEPAVYRQTRLMLLPKDFVRLRMTGRAAIDASDAAGTIAMDISKKAWAADILKDLGIDAGLLPEIIEATVAAGTLTDEAARACGLAPGTPVIAGGADNACAAVGNGITREGLVAVSTGTSGTVIAPTARPLRDPAGRAHTFNHAVPELWYVMGVMLSAGGSLRWWRDEFGGPERLVAASCGLDPYELMGREAERVAPGCEGAMWLPYLTGERTPHADANARGVLFGLSARHTRGHAIRAVMEGVAFGLRDSLEIIRALKIPIEEIRLTGGGARSALWRQIQADVFGSPVTVLRGNEGPAFGAAILAGVGADVYPSCDAAARRLLAPDKKGNKTVKGEVVEPIAKNVALYDRLYGVYRDLYRALKPSFDAAAKIVSD